MYSYKLHNCFKALGITKKESENNGINVIGSKLREFSTEGTHAHAEKQKRNRKAV
jgi:hypothetical protein